MYSPHYTCSQSVNMVTIDYVLLTDSNSSFDDPSNRLYTVGTSQTQIPRPQVRPGFLVQSTSLANQAQAQAVFSLGKGARSS